MRAALYAGGALLMGLALIILVGALRVRLDRGSKEPMVLRLLGASSTFLAIPTSIAGALLAMWSALLAALAITGTLAWQRDAVIEALAPTLGRIELAPLTGVVLVLFVLAAGLLGAIAGALAGVARAIR